MTFPQTLTVADRFGLTLGGLCRAVAARVAGGAMAVAMIVLVWHRVKRVEREILGLLARFQAGRLRVLGGGRSGGGGGSRPRAVGVPQRFGWLLGLMPYEAASYAGQVRALLGEGEMVALLGASPQAQRVLAPLCRMLGIEAAVLTGGVSLVGAGAAVVAAPVVEAVARPEVGASGGVVVGGWVVPGVVWWSSG